MFDKHACKIKQLVYSRNSSFSCWVQYTWTQLQEGKTKHKHQQRNFLGLIQYFCGGCDWRSTLLSLVCSQDLSLDFLPSECARSYPEQQLPCFGIGLNTSFTLNVFPQWEKKKKRHHKTKKSGKALLPQTNGPMEVSHIVLKSGTGKTLIQVVRKAVRNWSN